MTNPQRDRCAELVEQIRQLARAKPLPDDWEASIGECCNQLIMILQPITIRRPPSKRRTL